MNNKEFYKSLIIAMTVFYIIFGTYVVSWIENGDKLYLYVVLCMYIGGEYLEKLVKFLKEIRELE